MNKPIQMTDQTSSSPAKVGDVYHFRYRKEPKFNCDLKVTEVLGKGPDDLVMFEDSTNSKQKHLVGVPHTRFVK